MAACLQVSVGEVIMDVMVVRCSRCGKKSVLKKTWEEKLETRQGVSLLKHEQYSCPDDDCQVLVDKGLLQKRLLAAERELASQERERRRMGLRIKTQ